MGLGYPYLKEIDLTCNKLYCIETENFKYKYI